MLRPLGKRQRRRRTQCESRPLGCSLSVKMQQHPLQTKLGTPHSGTHKTRFTGSSIQMDISVHIKHLKDLFLTRDYR